jgi:hypothetical protein
MARVPFRAFDHAASEAYLEETAVRLTNRGITFAHTFAHTILVCRDSVIEAVQTFSTDPSLYQQAEYQQAEALGLAYETS